MTIISTAEHSPAPDKRRMHLLMWIPSLYIMMGLPNVMVGAVAAIMYKNMGVSTEDIAIYTSQLYLPWALKPLWAPFLERFRSKRRCIVSMHFVITTALGMVAFSLPHSSFFAASLTFFWVVGFASATQDIVIDGLFMATTTPGEQAGYAGLQGMCWNIGAVIASGLLVSAAGQIHATAGLAWVHCWMIVMGIAALAMGAAGLWHLSVLPSEKALPRREPEAGTAYSLLRTSWGSFFKKPEIWMMILVVFSYRFGEGFIERLGPIFLLEARELGGLGLSNQLQGLINGSLGTASFIMGAFLGGFLVAKMTLRRAFFILALSINVPHVAYFYLSHALPTDPSMIAIFVFVEKFGFGMGSVGHMLYMVQQLSPGDFRMTHYAFATSIMAMTKWLTGWISGPIFVYLDSRYSLFFLFVLFASIPPVMLALFAPFPNQYPSNKVVV